MPTCFPWRDCIPSRLRYLLLDVRATSGTSLLHFAKRILNPFTQATVRDSSPAEVEALQKVCDQLGGFNPDIHLEWVDGYLTSLAAGPVLPTPEVWLPALCGDAFERAFADPASQQQAQRVLHTRLKVLCEQLKPEALLQDDQPARLAPLMMEWTDAEREKLLQDGILKAEDLPTFQIGAEWAMGFIDGTEAFGEAWLGPLDDEADEVRAELLDQVGAALHGQGRARACRHAAQVLPRSDAGPRRRKRCGSSRTG